MIQKYKKKPIVIEALQWKANDNIDDVNEMLQFLENKNCIPIDNGTFLEFEGKTFILYYSLIFSEEPSTLIIKTLEGDMKASKDDYIIKGVHGEYYPCKPDIFEKTYEKIE